MSTYRAMVATCLALFIALFVPIASQAQIVRPGATNLIFQNSFTSPVTVMVQIPNLPCAAPCILGDGCPAGTVANLRYFNITTNSPLLPLTQFSGAFKGWFILPVGQKIQLINVGINPVTKQVSSCFQGLTIGFGQIGNSCPDFSTTPQTAFPNTTPGPGFNSNVLIPLPNGSNSFEPTLNLPGTAGGLKVVGGKVVPTTEAIDISCVNGANSILEVTLTPPVNGPYWTANLGPALGGLKTFKTATTLRNSTVNIAAKIDNNCQDAQGNARPGVYPYGCSVCNVKPDPAPPCLAQAGSQANAQFCAANNKLPPTNGCLFTRANLIVTPSNGVQTFGGTVLVKYIGPAIP